MTTFISLLRGINVSGQKSIRMADLRKLYENLGFGEVQSYLQSGNVVFQSESKNPGELEADIHAAIAEEYGYDVSILVLPAYSLEQVFLHNPFLSKRQEDPSRLYVTFLAETPADSVLDAAVFPDHTPDEFVIVGREIYLFCPNGYGRTKLSNNFFERKLKVPATTRNWKTVSALHRLAGAGES